MSHILIEAKDRVLRIEIARPDKKNALTQDMYKAMADALAAADGDPAVRVVLIHGTRGCFTAGNDLGDFMQNPPDGENSPVFKFINALAHFEKPLRFLAQPGNCQSVRGKREQVDLLLAVHGLNYRCADFMPRVWRDRRRGSWRREGWRAGRGGWHAARDLRR